MTKLNVLGVLNRSSFEIFVKQKDYYTIDKDGIDYKNRKPYS